MARVVVIGGGLGGLAAAARLAKLGHRVHLVERGERLGGVLTPVTDDEGLGFGWDAGPQATLLPAVLRDLFRKTGRPLEQELDLVPLPLVREHRFEDGSSLRLAGGSRGAQTEAFEALRPGLGAQWQAYVDAGGDDWEVLRRHYFETPWDPERLPAEAAALLDDRTVLRKRLKRAFRDDRARLVAGHPHVADGHDLRNVPAWAGLVSYLEQTFGAWTVPSAAPGTPCGSSGMAALALALEKRLETRGVVVHTATTALDLVLGTGGAVVGVRIAATPADPEAPEAPGTHDGPGPTEGAEVLDADVVVCAIDPRRLPALARSVERTMPALPPVVTHLGLRDDPADPLPDVPSEVVLHGDPMLVVRTGGCAPAGHQAWTLHARGKIAEELPRALARRGLDVRRHVVTQVDLSPRRLVERWGGSPHGVLWQGRGTVRRRLGPTTPIPGVYAAGAHATPGGGVPFVGLSAALVAQVVGPA